MGQLGRAPFYRALDLAGGYLYWSQKGPTNGHVGTLRRAPLTMPAGQTSVTRTGIEVLVDALPGSTLFTLGGLHSELAMIMRDVKVDLLTPGELPESIRSRVLAEAKTI